ncbi:MAG: ATP-binding protein, partial [Minwuia sp.]|nr:ATP-binding protein [Minwuia sp.]
MADLKSDVVGQVARLPLRPSEANSLLPLFEAVSNSLHAIGERFGDADLAVRGRIDIEVLRTELQDGNSAVSGFIVSDNGIGLNETNFRSFCTPFSQHKMSKGGKGIGRLGWLKVFEQITVTSTFFGDGKIEHRAFDFILRENDQIATKNTSDNLTTETGTVVSLRDFAGAFGPKCPTKESTIIQRIIAHFLPVFAGDKSPQIVLH